ncbi:MAG: hypothetical protein OXE83_04275, partial [Gammaproteobacteria bacterium]|nr:hypothetical protein [Gammaproteobacteria bacterium]
AVKARPRPYSWIVGEDGEVSKYQPSQRDARTPVRMRVTELEEPGNVGDAPLSKDLLRQKSPSPATPGRDGTGRRR